MNCCYRAGFKRMQLRYSTVTKYIRLILNCNINYNNLLIRIETSHVVYPRLLLHMRRTYIATRDTSCVILTLFIPYTDGVGETFKALLYTLEFKQIATILVCFPMFSEPLDTSVIVLSSFGSRPIMIFFALCTVKCNSYVRLGISNPN